MLVGRKTFATWFIHVYVAERRVGLLSLLGWWAMWRRGDGVLFEGGGEFGDLCFGEIRFKMTNWTEL